MIAPVPQITANKPVELAHLHRTSTARREVRQVCFDIMAEHRVADVGGIGGKDVIAQRSQRKAALGKMEIEEMIDIDRRPASTPGKGGGSNTCCVGMWRMGR